MKKLLLAVLLAFLVGCATSVPIAGYTDSAKREVVLSGPPVVSLIEVPKISNLEMPTAVKTQELFPYSFIYEADGIREIIFQVNWKGGQEVITVKKATIENGIVQGKFKLAPSRAKSVTLDIYIVDPKGRRSNVLTKELSLL